MDRDWINSVRISDEYKRGVEEFIQFALCNANNNGHDGVKFRCPCVNCLNKRKLDVNKIRKHLLCDGFLQSYTTWTWHGELLNLPNVSVSKKYVRSTMDDAVHNDRLEDMIRDVRAESFAKMMNEIRQELMEEMKKKTKRMRLELRQEFLSQQHCVEPLVSPASISTKESCAPPTTSREGVIGQISQCELMIEGEIFPEVVALGKVYHEATTLHNVPLSPDVVKITVEKVRVADARVPLPTNEVTTVADAFQTFTAWPRYLVRTVLEPPVIISFYYINLYLYITSNLIQIFFIL